MPTPTYVPLATLTLASTDSEIIFSTIPATYRDLIIVVNPKNSVGANFFMQFNSDTGANYSRVGMGAEGAAVTSQALSAQNQLRLNLAVDLSTTQTGNNIIQIMDYSATDKHKTVLARGNNASTSRVEAIAGRWGSTDAVTSVKLYPSTGSFVADATFALYGIA